MDTVQYIILAIVIVLILGPALFADRSPILETSGNVHRVSTLPELNTLLSCTTYVVIDFYADWCPPCRAIAPIFSKLADEYASRGQLAFAKVNVDHLKDITKHYDVRSMPTFLFFKDGKPDSVAVQDVKSNTSGRISKDALVERIQGANIVLLRSVVQALAEKVQG